MTGGGPWQKPTLLCSVWTERVFSSALQQRKALEDLAALCCAVKSYSSFLLQIPVTSVPLTDLTSGLVFMALYVLPVYGAAGGMNGGVLEHRTGEDLYVIKSELQLSLLAVCLTRQPPPPSSSALALRIRQCCESCSCVFHPIHLETVPRAPLSALRALEVSPAPCTWALGLPCVFGLASCWHFLVLAAQSCTVSSEWALNPLTDAFHLLACSICSCGLSQGCAEITPSPAALCLIQLFLHCLCLLTQHISSAF